EINISDAEIPEPINAHATFNQTILLDFAIQDDGKLLLLGEAVIDLYNDNSLQGERHLLTLTRINDDGTFDTSFGAQGTTPGSGTVAYRGDNAEGRNPERVYNSGYTITAGHDGIFLGGYGWAADYQGIPIILKLKYDGSLDPSFQLNDT